MKKSILLLAVPVMFAVQTPAFAQAPASAQADVLKFVHQFVDGFNKGDTKMILSACADQTSIIDEFSPHEWHGSGACAKWLGDFEADAKKNGITDGVVTLGKASHNDVTGDHAYVVVPVDYAFKRNGKPEKEVGSIMAIALQKTASGWKIIGWSWAKH
jgi:ketosteroid isomerase-like protein